MRVRERSEDGDPVPSSLHDRALGHPCRTEHVAQWLSSPLRPSPKAAGLRTRQSQTGLTSQGLASPRESQLGHLVVRPGQVSDPGQWKGGGRSFHQL